MDGASLQSSSDAEDNDSHSASPAAAETIVDGASEEAIADELAEVEDCCNCTGL
jgi:hypothetical protein